MAVVAARVQVLGDVGEVGEVVGVLTRAVDVTNLVLTYQLLEDEGTRYRQMGRVVGDNVVPYVSGGETENQMALTAELDITTGCLAYIITSGRTSCFT